MGFSSFNQRQLIWLTINARWLIVPVRVEGNWPYVRPRLPKRTYYCLKEKAVYWNRAEIRSIYTNKGCPIGGILGRPRTRVRETI